MPEESWLPLAEVARRSNMPETTARRYARLFPEALPSKRQGRTVLYAPASGALLVRIGQLFAEGRNAKQVKDALLAEDQCIDVQAVGRRSALASQANQTGQTDQTGPANTSPAPAKNPVNSASGPRTDLSRHRLAEFLRHLVDQKQAIASLREDFSLVRRELAEERARRQALEAENRKFKKALLVLIRQRRKALATGQAGQGRGLDRKADSEDLRAKLGVLEKELVRLRKDGREMEKYLLEKIGQGG